MGLWSYHVHIVSIGKNNKANEVYVKYFFTDWWAVHLFGTENK